MTKLEKPAPAVIATEFPDHTVIVPPHRLQSTVSRIGESTEIAMDAIAQAEDALNEIKSEFRGWMNDECETMEAARMAIHREGRTPESIRTIFAAAHDIRGHAAVFGYPLAGKIAGTLCRLIDECAASDIPLTLVDSHVDAVRAVIREGVHDIDHRTGGEIYQRLAEITGAHLAQFGKNGAESSQALPNIESPRL